MHTSTISRRFSAGALLVLLLALPWLSGCDDGTLNAPAIENDLFNSYVAIGNSITAGFQSGGINAETQAESFAVLLANQMNTPFGVPEMATPGCPPPLTQIFPEPQVQGGDPDACAFREERPPLRLNNVAVPGAAVADVLTNTPQEGAEPNPLTQFILGGQTQVEAARAADPTFVTAWTGNNDVLGAALAGNPALATSEEDFTTRYDTMLDELDALPNLEGAALFSVVDVTQIPNLSAGAAYAAAIPQAPAALVPANFELNACATSEALIPFQYGTTAIGLASGLTELFTAIGDQLGQPVGTPPDIVVDCENNDTFSNTYGPVVDGVITQLNQQLDALEGGGQITGEERAALQAQLDEVKNDLDSAVAGVADISILTPAERDQITAAVQAYNAHISTQADDRGYAFVDVNTVLDQRSQQIPPFPDLTSNQPFGPLFSLDGVHPSSAAHEAVADATIEAINNTYESANIPPRNP